MKSVDHDIVADDYLRSLPDLVRNQQDLSLEQHRYDHLFNVYDHLIVCQREQAVHSLETIGLTIEALVGEVPHDAEELSVESRIMAVLSKIWEAIKRAWKRIQDFAIGCWRWISSQSRNAKRRITATLANMKSGPKQGYVPAEAAEQFEHLEKVSDRTVEVSKELMAAEEALIAIKVEYKEALNKHFNGFPIDPADMQVLHRKVADASNRVTELQAELKTLKEQHESVAHEGSLERMSREATILMSTMSLARMAEILERISRNADEIQKLEKRGLDLIKRNEVSLKELDVVLSKLYNLKQNPGTSEERIDMETIHRLGITACPDLAQAAVEVIRLGVKMHVTVERVVWTKRMRHDYAYIRKHNVKRADLQRVEKIGNRNKMDGVVLEIKDLAFDVTFYSFVTPNTQDFNYLTNEDGKIETLSVDRYSLQNVPTLQTYLKGGKRELAAVTFTSKASDSNNTVSRYVNVPYTAVAERYQIVAIGK